MPNAIMTGRRPHTPGAERPPIDRRRPCLILIVGAIGTVASRAQAPEPPPDLPVAPPQTWSAAKLAQPIMDHLVGRIAEQYRFDSAQREQMQTLVRRRFSTWVGDNLAAIQPAMDEFAAAQQGPVAPEPADVAQWAERVLPLVRSFADAYNDTAEEMRAFLRSDQIVQLEGDRAAFAAGVEVVNERLGVWADGGFDPTAEWSTDPEVRRATAEEQRIAAEQRVRTARSAARASAAAAGVAGAAPAAAAPPPSPSPVVAAVRPALDEWEQYVEEFIRRYDLTEEQRQQAQRFLRDRRQSRDEYRRRNAASIAEAQRLVAGPDGPERSRAQATIDRLASQSADQFRRLKAQLETIPTRQQRRAAQAPTPAPHTQPAPSRRGD